MDEFSRWASYISPGGLISENLSSRIQQARLAFTKLSHLWRQGDIQLSTKRPVHIVKVRSVLFCGLETKLFWTDV